MEEARTCSLDDAQLGVLIVSQSPKQRKACGFPCHMKSGVFEKKLSSRAPKIKKSSIELAGLAQKNNNKQGLGMLRSEQ